MWPPNRLTEIRDGAGVLSKSFALSTGGGMASQAVAGGPAYDYVYSPRGRLASLKQGGVEVATYLYDYAGHRVVRTFPATPQTVHYVYNKDGQVIAEHDGATGALLREYVWLGEMPLALITGSAPAPQYHFIHTGQLDEPLLVTDMAQARQWDAVSDPWGNALPLATPTIAQDLRLPGQSLQIESGLFHNWHRDYDPTLGRYIEADPIGLAGGGNVFAYVEGNPLRYIDPDGLRASANDVAGAAIELWLKDTFSPSPKKLWRKTPWTAVGSACGTAIGAAIWYFNQDDDDPCEIQEKQDIEDCNQWHIKPKSGGYTRWDGFRKCMSTVATRRSECTSRGRNPNNITTPLFLPDPRRPRFEEPKRKGTGRRR